jgi:hypothetical protein
MSTTVEDREMAGIRRSFTVGLILVVVVFVGLFVGLGIANGNRHRPEGTAEHWLAAVGDTTRKGVTAEATKRAEKDGPVAVAKAIIPADTDKKSAFPDLEVGKATVTGATARVPYLLHQRAKTGKNPKVQGDVVLQRSGNSWKVTGLTTGQSTGQVPSEGGSPPSRAPAILWLIAVVVGVAVTAGASALVVWAGAARRAVPAS